MIVIQGATEHNLQSIDATINDGLTVVTGVSGSGKTSLIFDTLYHEARRRFGQSYVLGPFQFTTVAEPKPTPGMLMPGPDQLMPTDADLQDGYTDRVIRKYG